MYEAGYQYGEAEWFGELLAAPVDPRYPEPVRRSWGAGQLLYPVGIQVLSPHRRAHAGDGAAV